MKETPEAVIEKLTQEFGGEWKHRQGSPLSPLLKVQGAHVFEKQLGKYVLYVAVASKAVIAGLKSEVGEVELRDKSAAIHDRLYDRVSTFDREPTVGDVVKILLQLQTSALLTANTIMQMTNRPA